MAIVATRGGRHNGGRGAPRGRGRGGRSGGRTGENHLICQLCGRPGHVVMKCYHRFDVTFHGNN